MIGATDWQRSAIVWAFTVKRQGARTSISSDGGHTVAEFARLGLPGLSSQNTADRPGCDR